MREEGGVNERGGGRRVVEKHGWGRAVGEVVVDVARVVRMQDSLDLRSHWQRGEHGQPAASPRLLTRMD